MSGSRPTVLIAEFDGWRTFWLEVLGWGRMYVFRRPRPRAGEPWALDNGAYTAWTRGKPWDSDAYMRRLDVARSAGNPLFGVVPDIVAGGLESLEFSLAWFDRLPSDWSWYLAVQDGMTTDDVSPIIDRFDGVFLGGSDEFKSQAWRWCEFTHRHGKRFHFGRCGTPRKLDIAASIRADSLDSSFPLWTDKRFWSFAHRWMHGDGQLTLFGQEDEDAIPAGA